MRMSPTLQMSVGDLKIGMAGAHQHLSCYALGAEDVVVTIIDGGWWS